MAILGILATALAMGGVAPAQDFNMAEKADLCAADPAAVVRPDGKGVTARYVFRIGSSLTPPVAAFFDGLDRTRFAVDLNVETPGFSLVFVWTRIPARDAEQVRAEAKILCGFAKIVAGKMALFERFDAGDSARYARKREEKAAVDQKRAKARARKELAKKLASPVSQEEVTELLRSPQMLRIYFDNSDPDLKLGAIRELECSPMKNRESSCSIALPIFQHGEPRYAEIYAPFWRDETGVLHYDDRELVLN